MQGHGPCVLVCWSCLKGEDSEFKTVNKCLSHHIPVQPRKSSWYPESYFTRRAEWHKIEMFPFWKKLMLEWNKQNKRNEKAQYTIPNLVYWGRGFFCLKAIGQNRRDSLKLRKEPGGLKPVKTAGGARGKFNKSHRHPRELSNLLFHLRSPLITFKCLLGSLQEQQRWDLCCHCVLISA